MQHGFFIVFPHSGLLKRDFTGWMPFLTPTPPSYVASVARGL
jgi:hypothetical protein